MIVWIDGANGVGKSHVAAELADAFIDKNAEYVESDLCWVETDENGGWNNVFQNEPKAYKENFEI